MYVWLCVWLCVTVCVTVRVTLCVDVYGVQKVTFKNQNHFLCPSTIWGSGIEPGHQVWQQIIFLLYCFCRFLKVFLKKLLFVCLFVLILRLCHWIAQGGLDPFCISGKPWTWDPTAPAFQSRSYVCELYSGWATQWKLPSHIRESLWLIMKRPSYVSKTQNPIHSNASFSHQARAEYVLCLWLMQKRKCRSWRDGLEVKSSAVLADDWSLVCRTHRVASNYL